MKPTNLLLIAFSLITIAKAEPDRKSPSDWQVAADAAREGRFEAASATLEKILHFAVANDNAADAARAILLKIQADSSHAKQDGNILYSIQTLSALLDKTSHSAPPHSSQPRATLPSATISILHYALANQYAQLIPTPSARRPAPEASASDYRRYFAEAAHHCQLALANPALLQQTPIETFDPLVILDEHKRAAVNTSRARSFADECRPTLYDFLVFETIDLCTTTSESRLLAPENLPTLPDDAPLLAPLDAFLAWQPASATNWSAVATLYQNLLHFHQNDPAPQLALAEADLQRIMWAASLLSGSNTPSKVACLYKAALHNFIEHWRDVAGVPTVTTACAELAALQFESAPAAARATAAIGARLYPDSSDAGRCRTIIARLEAPDLIALFTEHTWNAPWPDITIIYRNISQVHFRIVPCDWEEFFKNKHGPLNQLPKQDLDALLNLAPAQAWSVAPRDAPASDLEIREEKYSTASVARSLKPGFYFVIASDDKEFSREGSRIFCAPVWVSDLAIVHAPVDDGLFSGFVVDALTGNPVSGASVTAWLATTNMINGRATTSADGAFSIAPIETPLAPTPAYNCYLVARTPDGRAIASSHALGPPPPSSFQVTANRAFFFTDRSVYNPGETIHYKILAVRKSDDGRRPVLLANHDVFIELRTPNEKISRTQTIRTDAFGSASGSFTLPKTNATGAYYLSCDFQKIIGNTMITVVPHAATTPPPPEPTETITVSAGLSTTTAPVTLTIATSSDSSPISARGTLSIHPVKEPKKASRSSLLHFRNPYAPPQPAAPDSGTEDGNPDDLPLEKPRVRQDFTTTGENGTARITAKLPAGLYRAIASVRGPSGKTITASTVIRVFNPKARRSPTREDICLEAESWELHPGDTFKAIWASGGKNARACFTFMQDGKILRRFWTQPGVTQQTLDFPIIESMRGGVCLRVFQVNDNRFVTRRYDIFVPHDNRLAVDWDRGNAPPHPGARATWAIGIQNSDTTPADASVVAVLYDNMLDRQFRHEWPALTGVFRFNYPGYDIRAATNTIALFDRVLDSTPPQPEKYAPEPRRRWNASAANLPGRSAHVAASKSGQPDNVTMMEKYTVTDTRSAVRKRPPKPEIIQTFLEPEKNDPNGTLCVISLMTPSQASPRLRPAYTVATANAPAYQANPPVFFSPALRTGKDGKLRIDFDMPENMARPKLMLFAHDRQMNFALFTRNFAASPGK